MQKEFLLRFALFAHVLISLSTVAKFIKVCSFANKIFNEYSSVIICLLSLKSSAIIEA